MDKIKVVVIDDIDDVLEILMYNIRKEGMDISVYTDSKIALAEISKSNPDIVITDWMMPEPDGLEVCRALKTNDKTKNIPLMMLTCKSTRQNYLEALAAGASDYVVKPVRMEEIIRRIKLLVQINSKKHHLA